MLRIDDMQFLAKLMIYKAYALIYIAQSTLARIVFVLASLFLFLSAKSPQNIDIYL